MGTTDAERFSYFLIAALIAGYSIVKNNYTAKEDLSNTPLSDDADGLDLAEQLEIKKKSGGKRNRFRAVLCIYDIRIHDWTPCGE